MTVQTTIGVLALQGDFAEHIAMLKQAGDTLRSKGYFFDIIEVRTPQQLARADALVIPGGESTAISLVAERSGMLEPLRSFVKIKRKPVWGTCAGMILLSEKATRTSRGGQQLIGGLDVTVVRNHFGRQLDSFTVPLRLPFFAENEEPHTAVFIRAPIVAPLDADVSQDTIGAVAKGTTPIEGPRVIATLPAEQSRDGKEAIIAVQQGNVTGISFHPELTDDSRVHEWWLTTQVFAPAAA